MFRTCHRCVRILAGLWRLDSGLSASGGLGNSHRIAGAICVFPVPSFHAVGVCGSRHCQCPAGVSGVRGHFDEDTGFLSRSRCVQVLVSYSGYFSSVISIADSFPVLLSTFLSSDFTRRSIFFISSSGGSSSGFIPLFPSTPRTS